MVYEKLEELEWAALIDCHDQVVAESPATAARA